MGDGSKIVVTTVNGKPRVRARKVGDMFCGAGGLSTGAARALRSLGHEMELYGINHWDTAIETNKRNHPDHADRIRCADLETALPLDHVPGGVLDLLLAAPSCVFHSRARGGKPVHDQQRMDPWHVVRWCTELRVKRLLVENVPEFMDWGPCDIRTGRPIKSRKGEYFRAWVAALQAIGFRVKWDVLCAANYGDATTRRRFFLIACSDGKRLRWPEPEFAQRETIDLVGARKKWRGASEIIDWGIEGKSIFNRKRPLAPNTLRRIRAGAIRYGWPLPYIHAVDALLEGREPILDVQADNATPMLVHFRGTSAHAIHNTARDIQAPLPTLTAGGGHVGFVMATGSGGAARDLTQPLPTITTGGAGNEKPGNARPQLIEPLIVPLCNTSSIGVPRAAAEPLRTITTAKGGDMALAQPLVASYYGNSTTASPATDPVPAVTTKARFGLAEPFVLPVTHQGDTRTHGIDNPLPTITGANRGELGITNAVVMRGNVGTGRTGDMRSAEDPMPTITTSESLALANPLLMRAAHGDSDGRDPSSRLLDASEPLPTQTASGEFSIASPTVEGYRIDINYRMLHWRELSRATSFDDEGEEYDFAGTATEITKQIGNAVPCRMGKALVRALMEDAA